MDIYYIQIDITSEFKTRSVQQFWTTATLDPSETCSEGAITDFIAIRITDFIAISISNVQLPGRNQAAALPSNPQCLIIYINNSLKTMEGSLLLYFLQNHSRSVICTSVTCTKLSSSSENARLGDYFQQPKITHHIWRKKLPQHCLQVTSLWHHLCRLQKLKIKSNNYTTISQNVLFRLA